MCPNLLQHLIAFSVRAREEGLSFGLDEFRQFMLVKRNEQSPGTFLVSTRPGRHVIENISYRDDFWREEFFVFKVDRASVGDFDFSRLQRNWITGIGILYLDNFLLDFFKLFAFSFILESLSCIFSARLGQSSFSDQVRGLLHAFRCGQVQWESFSMDRIRSAFLLPRGEGIAPTIGEVTPTSGWLEASSSEPPQDLALTRSSRRRPRRSSFHASRSILRIGTGTGDSQRSPISLSSGSQGNSASPSRGRAGPPQSDIPDSSRSRLRSRSKRQRVEDVGPAEVDLGGSDAPQAASSSFFASKEREAYAKIAAANVLVCFFFFFFFAWVILSSPLFLSVMI